MSNMNKTAVLISCIITLWFSAVPALAWTGKVVDIREGDVLKVSHPEKGVITMMLYGIDAPDKKQPFYKQAKEFLTDKVEGQVVNVLEFVTEQKVVTAIIVHDGVNINEQVLQAGYGWVYKKYCHQDFCSDSQGILVGPAALERLRNSVYYCWPKANSNWYAKDRK
jgi:endonuclease YncB( thermonuclease family)